MKTGGKKFWLALAAVIFLIVAASNRAQTPPIGQTTEFTSDTYFEPPNEQQVKMRLSGASASPLPGGLLDVKNLKVEVFNTNGVQQLQALAPQCTYAPLNGVASSSGHLEFHSDDGKFRTEGDGFLLRQTNGSFSLTISNNVHSVMEIPTDNQGLFL
ncbi:MAG TPA: hypothetical protein VIK53_04600 [Verrucomicrobiae bacterium]